jgi:hypothetical protein
MSDPSPPQGDAGTDWRVELPDGRVLAFRGSQVVAFNLFEAQRRARRGTRTRRQAVADAYRRDDGTWEISDPNEELDLMSDLAAAVLFSYAALEGLGNLTIEELDPAAIVEVERDGKTIEVSRGRMEHTLSVWEKLSLVVPAFTGKPSIAGTALWDRLMRLRRLHDALVHPRSPVGTPGILGLLMRGDADTCAEDAIAVVRTVRPELLPTALL